MVSGERCLAADDELSTNNMKEMIGGCCVCSDERGWAENPLVYCDGHGCNVAVHQACYGIVQVPTGPWFCRKCESQERAARVRCELCPHKDGALKRTDNGGWAHVVCALYIPEVEFANVSTMEPIVLQSVPHERYNKTCYICEDQGRESKAATGACMTCNKHGCRQAFHVTCAQFAGLLCEEQGSDADNVKYCGYCKYHHSKLKHKERDRHKPKHKKTSMDMSPSLVLPNIMVPDKNYNSSSSGGGVTSLPASSQKRLDDGSARFTTANFQEVSSALSGSGSKDGLAADTGKAASEAKNKKNSGASHAVGQRGGRKSLTSSGKPLPSAVVTMATSSTSASASTGPFHQGLLLTSASKTPSAPSSSDFLSFSDSSLRSGGGTTFSSPPSFSSCLVKPSSEGGASEGTTTLFGSLMSATTASAVGGKLYENSHSLTASETTSLSGSAGYKRPQPASSVPGIGGAAAGGGEDGVKKKKKGNWRNRFGPCFTTDVKPSEPAPSLALPTPSTANTSSSSIVSPSSSSSSTLTGRPGLVSSSGLGVGMGGGGERGLGVMGVSGGIQKSPSLLRNGSLQSNSSSTTTGPGVFSGADGSSLGTGAVAVGGAGSELSQQQQPTPSLAPPSPFTATAPLTSTASTHVSGLPGSVFNLAPSHMFGNRLNPNSAMAALIAQSEASPADQEVGDGSSGVGAQGFSIRASPKTTPRSPIGGLQIRYDSSGSLPGPGLGLLGAGGGGGETLPPVATSIEQLLERQWNEGQSFLLQQGAQGDVVGMLKSLHQLQEENRRLEEQIKTLTMKKERLQLLSAQLSVPFTPTTASSDVKGTHVGATDSSLPMAAQDGASCGGHSSSGSTSSLSTPPSVSQSPPQPQLNGVAAVGAAPAGLGGVAGLMGALGAGSALGMGGIVGALNGVIQTPAGTASPHTHTTGAATGVTLPVNNSAARLGLLSEQHRLLLQQHQLQQLLSSQPSAEQQQVLLYQLMQQQQDLQQLQSLSSSAQIPSIPLSSAQLPINNLLPAAQSQGQGAITANPFLALQHAHADTHASGAQKPRLAEKAVGVAGQEKT
ncbi:protein AF-10 isoform X2 [Plectropomus leopardus]|uniref:protein AF-10 isoform X2 n=1 Tax=Plectropomus leopardus TaxID=160734 RepID=UPI001C4B803C|nr:protein AF-10 isoform X2 [Plectropomus leopardus]